MVAALCSNRVRARCTHRNQRLVFARSPTLTARTGYLPASFALRADDSEDASIVRLRQVTFTSKDTPGIPNG